MKLLIPLILFTANIDCQILFPDDFEPVGQSTSNNGRQRPQIESTRIFNSSGNHVDGQSNTAPNSQFLATSDKMTSEENHWSNYVNNMIARGIMKYSLDMDHAIHASQRTFGLDQDPKNVIFSPISLVGTLAVVLLGSAGKTFEELTKVLGFESSVDISEHSEIIHRMLGSLLSTIHPQFPLATSGPQASFTHGIFVQNGYPIREEFLAISQAFYRSEVMNLDFLHHSDSARSIINNWVNMKTHGKIKNILAQPLDVETKVIFASALYFNGEWNQHFIHSGTKRRPFKLASGRDVDVDMMFNSGYFPFYEDEQLGIRIVGLPYKNSERSPIEPSDFTSFESTMYILLPTSTNLDALRSIEARLTPELVETIITKMENKTCIIGLPKMKLSSTQNLNRALQSLGLKSLFIPNEANLALLSPGFNSSISRNWKNFVPYIFPRMNEGALIKSIETPMINSATTNNYSRHHKLRSGRVDPEFVEFIEAQEFSNYGIDILRNDPNLINPGLYASDVIHEVKMDITETGTIGAAASSVIIQRDGRSKIFVANRPFKFFIRHGPSRLIIFWGSINKPTPNYS